MNVVLMGVLAYILVQLAFGIFVSRQIKDESDYLLAGRQLGPAIATFTIFATWFGAETCIGAAGAIYDQGLSGGSVDPFGYSFCLLLMGAVFAMPLWRRQYVTFGDLFRERFSPSVEKLAVLLLVPTSIIWAGAQIRGFGQILSALSDFDVSLSITIAASVVVIYTVYGGLLADAMTDFVQGIALIAGIAAIFIAILWYTGGPQNTLASIDPERLHLFGGPDTHWLEVIETWAVPIFGSVLAQELIARILACRTPEIARNAALMGGGLYLVVGLMVVFIGLAGVNLIPNLDEPEQILPLLAEQHLSTFFYVVFAGALISAILSTVDSALLAASALVSHNVLVPMAPNISERAKVRFARAGVILFGIIAYVLALYTDGVYSLVETASAFGSAGIFVVAVFGLFTRFGGARSALATLVAGISVWVWAEYVSSISTPYLLSLAVALTTYIVFALIERREDYAAIR